MGAMGVTARKGMLAPPAVPAEKTAEEGAQGQRRGRESWGGSGEGSTLGAGGADSRGSAPQPAWAVPKGSPAWGPDKTNAEEPRVPGCVSGIFLSSLLLAGTVLGRLRHFWRDRELEEASGPGGRFLVCGPSGRVVQVGVGVQVPFLALETRPSWRQGLGILTHDPGVGRPTHRPHPQGGCPCTMDQGSGSWQEGCGAGGHLSCHSHGHRYHISTVTG